MSEHSHTESPLDALLDDTPAVEPAPQVAMPAPGVAAEPAPQVAVPPAADQVVAQAGTEGDLTQTAPAADEPDADTAGDDGPVADGPVADAAVASPDAANSSNTTAGAKRQGKARRRHRRREARHTKEAFWVRIPVGDGATQFFPATDYIGKKMPFSAPKETCAVRVYEDSVCFSLLHLTNKAAKTVKNQPITIPPAPLARLSRRVAEMDLDGNKMVVERRYEAADGSDQDQKVTMTLTVNEAGVASLDSDDEAAEEPFELSRRGERISLYLVSPKVPRRIALGWMGHIGRPSGAETMIRAAAKILNAASALPDFTLLTGIEAVDIPAMSAAATVVRPEATDVSHTILARFFTDPAPGTEPAQVAEGGLTIEVDLEHANASAGRLLFKVTPTESLEEFYNTYRTVIDEWAGAEIEARLGDSAKELVYDIVLGSVSPGAVADLSEKMATIPPTDFTPTLRRYRT